MEIESIVSVVRKIYMFLLIVAIIAVVSAITEMYSDTVEFKGRVLLHIIIYLSIYWGLRNKSNWVMPFILIISAFGFLLSLIEVLSPAENASALFKKIADVFFILFFGYQMVFFSSSNVRKYFGAKGKVIF